MWMRSGRAARALAGAVAVAVSLAVAPSAAVAKSKPDKSRSDHGTTHARARKGPQSIGAPNDGHLVGAIRLRSSKTLRQREGTHSWGLPQLVRLLHHAASAVARKHRGSQMLVGDLSGRTGGHIDHHGSHQTGRDADVGFYVTNSKGKPMAAKRFIPFDGAGNARDVPGVRFDDARNWAMVEAMLKDEKAGVHYLFITNGLRARLLTYATKKHVSKELIERAASAMMSPSDAEPHDDHMHVRIACPESMREVCVEEAVARDAPAPASPAPASPAAGERQAALGALAQRPGGAGPGDGSAK
jgi:penicillin-insensitive murein endopeptidase